MVEKKKPHWFIEKLNQENPFCEITIIRIILETPLFYKQTLHQIQSVPMSF